MAIKDILVHVGCSAHQCCVDVAASLATGNDAHLVGLHVSTQPDIPPYIEAQLGAEVVAAQTRNVEELRVKCKTAFDQAVGASGLSAEWRALEGDWVDAIQMMGRSADLVIVGQSDPNGPGVVGGEDVAGRLALTLGRPVLAVPYAGSYGVIGKRVMVAWDGSRAAARALGDALPLMQEAEMVNVLSVNPDTSAKGHKPATGADIVAHLARHGIKAEAQHIQAQDIETGAMMLSRAADFGADMFVMGAYGHARWRELVMGGVTRHMLEHMTLPVLMAH